MREPTRSESIHREIKKALHGNSDKKISQFVKQSHEKLHASLQNCQKNIGSYNILYKDREQ